jgi:rhodanese-related sulfurtransferase
MTATIAYTIRPTSSTHGVKAHRAAHRPKTEWVIAFHRRPDALVVPTATERGSTSRGYGEAMARSRPFLTFVVAVVTGLVLLTSCSSGDSAERPTTSTIPTAVRLVGPEAFARRVDEPRVVTINVHVPDEGSIAGTDESIPFDEISRSSVLPAAPDTPLAVYCRSGNMSADAVRDLEAMGYTDIFELDGGFNAWTEAGWPLLPPGT